MGIADHRGISSLAVVAVVVIVAIIAVSAFYAVGGFGTSGTTTTTPSSTSTSITSTQAPPCSTAPTGSATTVNLLVDTSPDGSYGPYYVALNDGYFQKCGLDVKFQVDSGSKTTIQSLSQGKVDMASADFGTMTQLAEMGNVTNVRAVGELYQFNLNSVIYIQGHGITTPKDLEGKKLGASVTSGSYALWPLFAAAAGINVSKVTIVNEGFTLLTPSLLNGQVDAILTFGIHQAEINNALASKGETAGAFWFKDYGDPAIGFSVLSSTSYIASHAATIQLFMDALSLALQASLANPSIVGPAFVQSFPTANATLTTQQWHIASAFTGDVATMATLVNPVSYMAVSATGVTDAITAISTAFHLNTVDATSLYTTQFTTVSP